MRQGFFSPIELESHDRDTFLRPQCGRCGLYQHCQNPKIPVDGKGKERILIVSDFPGKEEDRLGKPLVGPAGRRLESELFKIDIDMRRDCWLTNALICKPPKKFSDRLVSYCRPNVTRTIEELQPTVIITAGAYATESVLKPLWGEEMGAMARWNGWRVPCQKWNCWVCPVNNPAWVLRQENPVLDREFLTNLRAACSLRGNRPWEEIPDFASEVNSIMDPVAAAEAIRVIIAQSVIVAFDYETDRLKPDAEDSEIVCCSISNGESTIAYPWTRVTAEATRELLAEPSIGKIGANIKFEERWTKGHLGYRVRGWSFDTVLAAHCLDSRKGITGLKFQALVLLGQADYSSSIKPYLEAKISGGNEENRIRQADFGRILRYCGIDSLVEYKVAQIQARQLGVDI